MNTPPLTLDLATYCTRVPVTERIRVDLFTERAIRLRMSRLRGTEMFPPKYEIPFCIGKLSNWAAVPFTREETDEEVRVSTTAIQVRVSKFDFSFTVWTLDGTRQICPSGGPIFGMFRDGYTVFDSASAFREDNINPVTAHWFYNPETGRYSDTYLPPSSGDASEHRWNEMYDQFFIYGPDYPTLFAQMNELVGPEVVPDKKAFGFFQTQHVGISGSQEKFMTAARELRKRGIPCDTLIIDTEWGDGIPTDESENWGQSIEWNPRYCYPLRPEEMLAELKRMNFDVMVIHHNVPKFPNRAHQAWTCKEFPEDIWWSKLKERLGEGVRGVWMDTRRNDITDSVIFGGLQKHYGQEQRARFLGAYEMYRVRSWDQYDVKRWPWDHLIGARRYPMDWTGDCEYNWPELKWHVRAITNNYGSMRGYSYITSDSMGYDWKIQARWNQFTDFIAVSRSHNSKPWDGGLPDPNWANSIRFDELGGKGGQSEVKVVTGGPTAEESILRHRRLRYRLIPYLYSHALLNYQTGMPVCRPMLLAFPDDALCNRDQWPYQYLFGSELLVAPVCEDIASMPIYLPAGCCWMDWWDGSIHEGGQTLDYDTSDVGKLPLFLREGGILPMQDECEWIDAGKSPDPLWVTLYPPETRHEARFELREDDGVSLRYQAGEVGITPIVARRTGDAVVLEIGPMQGTYCSRPETRTYGLLLRGFDVPPVGATFNDKRLKAHEPGVASPEPGSWVWNPATRQVTLLATPGLLTEAALIRVEL